MDNHNDFYKKLADNLYDGVYFVDRERVITYWNKGAERITGYTASQTVGRACRDNLLNHMTADGVQLCLNDCPLSACMRDGKAREAEVFLHHADGYRIPVGVRTSPICDEQGAIIGAVEIFSNNEKVVNTRRQLDEIERTALTDPLTGIGNRRYLENRLSIAIIENHQIYTSIGLLFIDVHFLLRTLDGRITVDSEVGAGTRIGVVLPVPKAAQPAAPSAAPEAVSGGGYGAVLIVDDEPMIRKMAGDFPWERAASPCWKLAAAGKPSSA